VLDTRQVCKGVFNIVLLAKKGQAYRRHDKGCQEKGHEKATMSQQ